jgi:hypothetical protein
MRRTTTTSLAASALGLALAGSTSAGAFAQLPTLDRGAPGSPPPIPAYPDYRQDQTAHDAPQLFRFPGLSNKSGRLGDAGCLARPAATTRRPRVVATFPAEGSVVRPGLVVVRVTFDQPMACDASFAGASDLPNPCPGRWREVTVSRDLRSFRTVCEVKANTRYRLVLRSFRNGHGPAVPAEVTFSTSGAAPIATIQQALAEDPAGREIAGG